MENIEIRTVQYFGEVQYEFRKKEVRTFSLKLESCSHSNFLLIFPNFELCWKVLIEVGKLSYTEKRSNLASNFQNPCIPSSFLIVGVIPISHFQHKTLHFLSFSNYTFQLYINHYLVRMQSYLIANE